MQFRINTIGTTPDIDAIEDALRSVDPAAIVDLDPASRTLRVAASIRDVDLVGAMAQAGTPVALHQVERVPSECCGGCGG